jgi:hypothetical protein
MPQDENSIEGEITELLRQLKEIPLDNETNTKITEALQKIETGAENEGELKELTEYLEGLIQDLESGIQTTNFSIPEFSLPDLPLFSDKDGIESLPSIHLEISEQDGNRVLGREMANNLENKHYHTFLRENDFYLREEITDSTAEYDADLSLTINIGKEVLTVSYFFTLVFRGLVIGIFTKVGSDLYSLVKEKIYNKKDNVKPVVFEILLKELDSASRPHKNLRIYLAVKTNDDVERMQDAFNFIEENAEKFYRTESGKVKVKFNGKKFTWKEFKTKDLELPYDFEQR